MYTYNSRHVFVNFVLFMSKFVFNPGMLVAMLAASNGLRVRKLERNTPIQAPTWIPQATNPQ